MNPASFPDWQNLHFGSRLVDLHAHPSMNVSLFHRMLMSKIYPSSRAFDPFSVRTDYSKLANGGVDVLLSVVYAPEKGIFEECRLLHLLFPFMPRVRKKIYDRPYFDVTMQLLDEIEEAALQARHPQTGKQLIVFAKSRQDLQSQAFMEESPMITLVHCVEGGHSLDGKLENLEALAKRGVAYMVLAHFFENAIVNPCFPWPENIQKFGCFKGERDMTRGLNPFGEQVVEKMVELGMLIDVSHCTPSARARIYDIVGNRAPLLATHVGAYGINPDPYNLKDWEIRRIADSGGVVGVIFMNYWLMPRESNRGLNAITRTIEHFVQAGGIDHVGIGTDFDGFTDPPDDIKDASELPRLTQRLLAEGFSSEAVTKILGGNALRALCDGWSYNDSSRLKNDR